MRYLEITWRGWWAATFAGYVLLFCFAFAVGAAMTARFGAFGPPVGAIIVVPFGVVFSRWLRAHRPVSEHR